MCLVIKILFLNTEISKFLTQLVLSISGKENPHSKGRNLREGRKEGKSVWWGRIKERKKGSYLFPSNRIQFK